MSSYADYSEESDNPFVIFFNQRKEFLLKQRQDKDKSEQKHEINKPSMSSMSARSCGNLNQNQTSQPSQDKSFNQIESTRRPRIDSTLRRVHEQDTIAGNRFRNTKGVSDNEQHSQSSGIFFHEINDGLQTQASILSLNNFVTTHPHLIDQSSHDASQPRRRSHSESSSSDKADRSSTSDMPSSSQPYGS